jgi:hypothetical protein
VEATIQARSLGVLWEAYSVWSSLLLVAFALSRDGANIRPFRSGKKIRRMGSRKWRSWSWGARKPHPRLVYLHQNSRLVQTMHLLQLHLHQRLHHCRLNNKLNLTYRLARNRRRNNKPRWLGVQQSHHIQLISHMSNQRVYCHRVMDLLHKGIILMMIDVVGQDCQSCNIRSIPVPCNCPTYYWCYLLKTGALGMLCR